LAENETLDVNVSPRWQRICRAFRQGETESQMGKRIQENLYRFVGRSIKNIADRGVSLEELLHAATCCPRDLPELLRRCRQHTFARLIEDNAEESISRQELLLGVMADVWDRLADQFGAEVVGHGQEWTNYEDFHEFLDHIREGLQGDLEQIANRLADNAVWKPRPPCDERVAAPVEAPLFDGVCPDNGAVAPVDPSTEATRSLLGESLLNRRPEQ
jgi:hypothetical protein